VSRRGGGRAVLALGALALAASPAVGLLPRALAAAPATDLRPAADFAGIADPARRSAALFTEAGKVLTHPRCVNCHPAGDAPLQGDDGRPHQQGVRRGADDLGSVGMQCYTCHQDANFDPAGVPGARLWQLAPPEMAWEGLTLTEICAQLKDPARNGGRDLAAVAHHLAEDALVGWGWAPGAGRTPVPGTQERFGELIAAWIETGAVCP
jgi:mono/diheme cytochrome c family protein